MIFRQILLTISIRNVWRTVRRICIYISGLTRLKENEKNPSVQINFAMQVTMTLAQVVKMSASVTINSPSQDCTHPDGHTLPRYDYILPNYPTVRMGSSNTHFFFLWSLAPDLRFSLDQTNTSCRRSVNISTIFSRLAWIRKNRVENYQRCNGIKLSLTRVRTTMLASFEGQRFDVVYIFVGYAKRVKFNTQALLTGLLCFVKIFVYKVTRNLMELTSLQRTHGRRC